MAKSVLAIINDDTGEVIDNILFKLNDELYDPNDVGFKGIFNFKNNKSNNRCIRIFRMNDEEQIDEIDLNTEYDCENTDSLKKGCKYTKMFQTEDPMFSQKSYYQFWHKICCCLRQDTNVIYNRKPTLHKVRHVKELGSLCGGSHPSINKFMKECVSKGLIAEFKLRGEKEFVVNPRYALNGRKMPILLFNLFNDDDANDNCEKTASPLRDTNE